MYDSAEVDVRFEVFTVVKI